MINFEWYTAHAMRVYFVIGSLSTIAIIWLAVLTTGRHSILAAYWFYTLMAVWTMILVLTGVASAVLRLQYVLCTLPQTDATARILQRRISRLEAELTRKEQG